MSKEEFKKIFASFNLKDFEIERVLEQVDDFYSFTVDEIKDNLRLLSSFGVSKYEMQFILYNNPNVLFHDSTYLESALNEIDESGEDIAEYLKNNEI